MRTKGLISRSPGAREVESRDPRVKVRCSAAMATHSTNISINIDADRSVKGTLDDIKSFGLGPQHANIGHTFPFSPFYALLSANQP